MVKVLLFSLVVLSILVITLSISVLSIPPNEATFPLTEITLGTSSKAPQSFTMEKYNQQIETFLFLNSIQPTHRDILVNLALLYQAQNNEDKALVYWNSAQELDPNNQLFSTN